MLEELCVLTILTTRSCAALAGKSVTVSTSLVNAVIALPPVPPLALNTSDPELLVSSSVLSPLTTVKPLILNASIAAFNPVKIVLAFNFVSVAAALVKLSALYVL